MNTFASGHSEQAKRASASACAELFLGGYDPAHELIDDIKRKDFVASADFSDADAMSPQLKSRLVDIFKGVAPMVDYLCAALDLEF